MLEIMLGDCRRIAPLPLHKNNKLAGNAAYLSGKKMW